MNKKLKESLRYIQSHPTTGTPHNQQLISTQVESIFAIDNLQKEINKLSKTIIQLDDKNTELEKSNLRLQKQMLLLTTVATMIVVLQFLQTINFSLITTTIIVVVAGLVSFYYQHKYISHSKEEAEFLKSTLKDVGNTKTKISQLMKQTKKD